MGDLEPAATRLGLLGGTFDPIHTAHVQAALAAREALRLDRMLLIPAGDPWRKSGNEVTPAEHRLAMARAAAAGGDRLEVCDTEVRREGPSYTVDTLEAFREAGFRTVWFVLGADALLDLPRWHEPERLITLARLAVVGRPGAAIAAGELEGLLPGLAERVDWVPMTPVELSATELRERLAAGEAVTDWVAPAVLAYARQHGLYDSVS